MKIVRRIGLSYIDYLVDTDSDDEAVDIVINEPSLSSQIYFSPTYLSDIGFETYTHLSEYNNDVYYLDALSELINRRPVISQETINAIIDEIENDEQA